MKVTTSALVTLNGCGGRLANVCAHGDEVTASCGGEAIVTCTVRVHTCMSACVHGKGREGERRETGRRMVLALVRIAGSAAVTDRRRTGDRERGRGRFAAGERERARGEARRRGDRDLDPLREMLRAIAYGPRTLARIYNST